MTEQYIIEGIAIPNFIKIVLHFMDQFQRKICNYCIYPKLADILISVEIDTHGFFSSEDIVK